MKPEDEKNNLNTLIFMAVELIRPHLAGIDSFGDYLFSAPGINGGNIEVKLVDGCKVDMLEDDYLVVKAYLMQGVVFYIMRNLPDESEAKTSQIFIPYSKIVSISEDCEDYKNETAKIAKRESKP